MATCRSQFLIPPANHSPAAARQNAPHPRQHAAVPLHTHASAPQLPALRWWVARSSSKEKPRYRSGGAHRHHYVAAGDLAHGKARFDLHKKSPQSHSFTYTILYWGKTFNNLLKTILQLATFFYSFSLEAQQKNGYNNLGNFDKLLSIVGRSKSS